MIFYKFVKLNRTEINCESLLIRKLSQIVIILISMKLRWYVELNELFREQFFRLKLTLKEVKSTLSFLNFSFFFDITIEPSEIKKTFNGIHARYLEVCRIAHKVFY